MLDAKLKGQLKAYMEKLVAPIEIVATIGTDAKSRELKNLLREIAELSPSITYRENADMNERTPSFAIARKNEEARVRFTGIPMGHEFTSLVLALLQVSGYAPKIDAKRKLNRLNICAVNLISKPTFRCRARFARTSCRH